MVFFSIFILRPPSCNLSSNLSSMILADLKQNHRPETEP